MATTYLQRKMIFEAMGNQVRRNVVAALFDSTELAAADLAAGFDMSISGMMWHLQVLQDAGLITRHKVHNRNICHLNREILADMTDWPELVELNWLDSVAITSNISYNNP